MNLFVRLVLVVSAVFAISKGVTHFRKPFKYENVEEQLPVVRLVNGVLRSEKLNLSKSRYVAFYHSASWCGPCQAFSPHLCEFYHSSSKKHFELVMINYDRSVADMDKYMRQHGMEFPAVQQDQAGVWGKPPSGRSIPNLVVVDMETKTVVEEAFKGGDYQGPDAALQALREKLRALGR